MGTGRFPRLFVGWVGRLLQVQEVLQDLPPVLGEDALRMKLHAPDRELLVPHAHDFTLLGLRGDLQAVGHAGALDDQGMVAGGGEGIGHALEQVLAVMLNERGLAVHHAVVDDDVAAEDMADALVPQADAEGGDLRSEGADDFIGQPGFARRARPRRYQDPLRRERADLLDRNAVVAVDL